MPELESGASPPGSSLPLSLSPVLLTIPTPAPSLLLPQRQALSKLHLHSSASGAQALQQSGGRLSPSMWGCRLDAVIFLRLRPCRAATAAGKRSLHEH